MMRKILQSLAVVAVAAAVLFLAAEPAVADPSFGSDAAFPVAGIAANTVLDAMPGSPVLGPTAPPPATVLPSLIAPPNPPAFGEVEDISYGDENPSYFPMSVEYSTAPGQFPPAPEAGAMCAGAADEDGDGVVNDGCPIVMGGPEPFGLCANVADDDGDAAINDGCPPAGPVAPTFGVVSPMAPPPPNFSLRAEAGLIGPAPFGDGSVYPDVYSMFPGPVMFLPPCVAYGSAQLLDGDGAGGPPYGPPRLGINMPEPGSNVDAYERRDDATVTDIPGAPLIDRPIFFTIDALTASTWAGGPIPAPTAGAPVLAMPGPSDILAWNPAIGGPVIYATAAALGLGPRNNIDALAVSYNSGFPLPSFAPGPSGFDFEPAGPPGDLILYSLSFGSSALSPTSGGVGAFGSVCFGAGTATAGDLFLAAGAFVGSVPYIDAEQIGLGAVRSGNPADDNTDAIDICNTTPPPYNDTDGDTLVNDCDYDDDGDGVGDLVDPDDDGDGFGDPQQTLHVGPANTAAGFDNCPSVANPTQTNTDGNWVDHPAPIIPDDRTWARSDELGDACDPDDDNDGRSDADEASGAGCAGIVTSSLLQDHDADRVIDGAECLTGFDPTSAASKPTVAQCAAFLGVAVSTDTDADNFRDYLEFCYYNSSPTNTDSDGDKALDGAIDRCEIASLNPDRLVNVADRGLVAKAVSDPAHRHVNIDINKDGVFNVGDVGLVSISFGSLAVCTT